MSELQERLTRAIGDRYRIERELGRGGMSVVYLAIDQQHGRRVALKVLAPELARSLGAERFLREIEIAARLSHPRIVPLLDSGSVDELLFYAMPFIDGESLRDRLDREKQLPVEDAVEIARQVAAALAYAHDSGVIHRDIKPGNVLLTAGEAMVTDFGIAQAVNAASGSKLTETGIAVGTPAYMSPEQASGTQDVDARSDLYAIGCVLYEMLAGQPPFTGPSARAVTARKLREPAPDVSVLRDSVPPGLALILRKVLAPLPADRYSSAARFAEELGRSGVALSVDTARQPVARRSQHRGTRVAGVVAFALVAGLGAWGWLRPRTVPARPLRFSMTLAHSVIREVAVSPIALSPDGRTLIITGRGDNGQQLFRRTLDRLDALPIEGTEGGQDPFFSPDGKSLGFYAEGRLRRVPLEGGAPIDIATLSRVPVGAAWGPDDRIVFAPSWRSPLSVVDARGGEVTQLTALDTMAGEVSHVQPELLPDGHTLLFVDPGPALARPRIHAIDLQTGRRTQVMDGWAPHHSTGHLLLLQGSTLLAVPFDAKHLEITGTVSSIGDNAASYAASRNGTLAWVPRPASYRLLLIDGNGDERSVTDERPTFGNPQFSPNGDRLAVVVNRGTDEEVWTYDLAAGTESRLSPGAGRAPIWTPDGRAVTFVSLGRGVFSRSADGRGDAEQLLAIKEFHWLIGWTPDSRILGYGVPDVGIMSLENGKSNIVVPGDAWGGRLSWDGRWLAYYSLDTGSFEIWVTRFPKGGPKWQITTDGGRDPSWAPEGLTLYYRNADRLMAMDMDTTAGVRALSRRVVHAPFNPPFYDDYDIHPDLRTLAIVRPVTDPVLGDVVVLINALNQR